MVRKTLLLTCLFLFTWVVAHAGTVYLPKTGQVTCYDENGIQRGCSGTGEDGDIRAGIGWLSPRFTDNFDGTVTDSLTKLMWLKDANCLASQYPGFDNDGTPGDGQVFWENALNFVSGINSGTYPNCGAGHTDWRLPNVNELLSLHDFSWLSPALPTDHPFTNIGGSWYYWTSTAGSGNGAWAVTMFFGLPSPRAKDSWDLYLWPVRGVSNARIKLPKSGQINCYDGSGNVIDCAGTGQDGEIQAGVIWPNPRFKDNGDGTITDALTRLIWLKDANCAVTAGYDPDGTGDGRVTWQHALDFVKGVNNGTYPACDAGYTDWRLPNVIEIVSLVSPKETDPITWLNEHGFTNIQTGWHWSSTSGSGNPSQDDPSKAYMMFSGSNDWAWENKVNTHAFWLVRGGLFPNLSVSPSVYDFGDVTVGTPSPGIPLTVANTGAADLIVTSIGLVDSNLGIQVTPGGPSPCSGTMPLTLMRDSNCTFIGTSTPSTPGAQNAALRIVVNQPDAPVLDVPVSYIGVQDTYSKITLLTPNGRETLESGSPCTIRWGAPASAATFTLKYSLDNGVTWKAIVRGISGLSHVWTVPAPVKNMSKALVMVIGYDGMGRKVGYGKSKKAFKIEVVKLSAPNRGETLLSNTSYIITWTTNKTKRSVNRVKLSYTLNDGMTWKSITTLSGNPGIFDWTLPTVRSLKTKCKVKVVLRDGSGDNVGSDVSDAYFTISP